MWRNINVTSHHCHSSVTSHHRHSSEGKALQTALPFAHHAGGVVAEDVGGSDLERLLRCGHLLRYK